MRIYYKNIGLPKRAAKRVKKILSQDIESMRDLKLSTCQNLVAKMLGYGSWTELDMVTKKLCHEPSLLDSDCTSGEQIQRLEYQCIILSKETDIPILVSRQLVVRLRVSAYNPLSPDLIS